MAKVNCSKSDCGICNNKYYLGYWTKQDFQYLWIGMRWEELLMLFIPMLFLGLVYGFWGAFWWYFYFGFMEYMGFNAIYTGSAPDPVRSPCSAGVEDCQVCGNGYKHEWNVERFNNLKWYQRYY